MKKIKNIYLHTVYTYSGNNFQNGTAFSSQTIADYSRKFYKMSFTSTEI